MRARARRATCTCMYMCIQTRTCMFTCVYVNTDRSLAASRRGSSEVCTRTCMCMSTQTRIQTQHNTKNNSDRSLAASRRGRDEGFLHRSGGTARRRQRASNATRYSPCTAHPSPPLPSILDATPPRPIHRPHLPSPLPPPCCAAPTSPSATLGCVPPYPLPDPLNPLPDPLSTSFVRSRSATSQTRSASSVAPACWRVSCLGIRVWGLGIRVWGLGFRARRAGGQSLSLQKIKTRHVSHWFLAQNPA